jgi:hypothetical protein
MFCSDVKASAALQAPSLLASPIVPTAATYRRRSAFASAVPCETIDHSDSGFFTARWTVALWDPPR